MATHHDVYANLDGSTSLSAEPSGPRRVSPVARVSYKRPVDSSSWPGIVEALAAVCTLLVALVAVDIARAGLATWRDEMHGRSRYDLARKILRCVYAIRDAVAWVRVEGMLPDEYMDRPNRGAEQPPLGWQDFAYAYDKRWGRLMEALRELEANMLEAEALDFDGDLRVGVRALKDLIYELRRAISTYLRARRGEEVAEDKLRTAQDTIFEGALYADEDLFAKRLADAISSLEGVLKRHLRRPAAPRFWWEQ